jgi:hypothetical protein
MRYITQVVMENSNGGQSRLSELSPEPTLTPFLARLSARA